MIPAIPSTPQKKQERSLKDKGKATSSNELDELQLLKKEIKLLKKTKTIVIIQSYLIGLHPQIIQIMIHGVVLMLKILMNIE